MILQLEFKERGLPVPYHAVDRGDGGVNYGYMNLRANPALIDFVPELQDSPELLELIKNINLLTGQFQTLGCEKALNTYSHIEETQLALQFCSYVDVAFVDPRLNTTRTNYENLFDCFKGYIAGSQMPLFLSIKWEIQPTSFLEDHIQGYSVAIWVCGFGATEQETRANWSSGIDAIKGFLNWVKMEAE